MFAMRLRLFALLGSLSLTCACGSSTPATPTTPKAPAPAVAAAPAPAKPRVPSPELSRHWPFADKVELVVYADAKGFRNTELGASLLPSVLGLAADSTEPDELKCMEALLQASDEVLVGANGELGAVSLLRLDEARRGSALSACRKPLAGSKRAPILGQLETYQSGSQLIVVTPDCLIAAQYEQGAKAALAERTSAGPIAFAELPEDRYLAYYFALPEDNVEVRGGLLAASGRFLLDADVTLPSEQMAVVIEQATTTGRSRIFGGSLPPGQAEAISHVVDAVSVERQGNRIVGKFELVEDAAAQARDIGIVSALAIHGTRRYITQSRAAEARLGVGRIAKDLGLHLEAERDKNPRKKLRFFSLPAVPAAVPSGAKVQTAPADWQAWSKIAFQMTEPQYYQYEVLAAPDGKSAQVIARGDLNGDGKQSEFSLTMRIEADGSFSVDPALSEKDPLE
jgi:hypothetical protein